MTARHLLNGPVEVGLRAVVLLVEASPDSVDLQRLVALDYLLVHSGDIAGGPASLHPPSPLRAGEVAVRRSLIEQGLRVYRARGLVKHVLSDEGIGYAADDPAAMFLDSLSSSYVIGLRQRAEWIFGHFGPLGPDELAAIVENTLGRWRAEFAVLSLEGDSE